MFGRIVASFVMTAAVSAPLYAAAPAPAKVEPTAAPPASASTETKTYGDWVVRCFAIKAPVQCDLFQATVEKSSQRRIVSLSIAYAPGANAYVAKIIVPLGATIPDGLTLVTDKRSSKPLAYSRCEQDGCYLEGPLDRALVDRLLAAKAASIVMTTYGGPKVVLPVSLNGISDAIAAMRAQSIQRAGAHP